MDVKKKRFRPRRAEPFFLSDLGLFRFDAEPLAEGEERRERHLERGHRERQLENEEQQPDDGAFQDLLGLDRLQDRVGADACDHSGSEPDELNQCCAGKITFLVFHRITSKGEDRVGIRRFLLIFRIYYWRLFIDSAGILIRLHILLQFDPGFKFNDLSVVSSINGVVGFEEPKDID